MIPEPLETTLALAAVSLSLCPFLSSLDTTARAPQSPTSERAHGAVRRSV